MREAAEMRSTEIAALAGVSVRTMRHYHQIGLLAEPDRSANGYRRYGVQHLAALLRIRRFTELGIPLSEVRRVIDDPDAAAALLEQVDAEAAAEIERLEQRRRRIAALRDDGAAPDMPDALIPFAALLTGGARVSARERQYEREQLALVAHLSGDASLAWLVAMLGRLSQEQASYLPFLERFSNLEADAPPSQTEPIVAALVRFLAGSTDLDAVPPLSAHATELLLAHQRAHLNDAQIAVVESAIARLDA
ncbi:MerR family transcriptional regulator [Agrococcus sp. 1P02AA]|uniref:MerR family transcriptional regulator n=1 Tax=Agrococcus sp. 1P02AA TaxID=3132259 RepID=UPI0039A59E30